MKPANRTMITNTVMLGMSRRPTDPAFYSAVGDPAIFAGVGEGVEDAVITLAPGSTCENLVILPKTVWDMSKSFAVVRRPLTPHDKMWLNAVFGLEFIEIATPVDKGSAT